MVNNRKTIICGTLILVISLKLFTGLIGKYDKEIIPSKLTQQTTTYTGVIPATELKSIVSNGTVSLTDDSPDSIGWTPKDQNSTLNKVVSWLQQSKLYKGEVSHYQVSGTIHAHIGPSKLHITTSDKHVITIQPAFYFASNNRISIDVHYITDVLELNNDEQKIYIQSSNLFNWLKSNNWKQEFEN